MEINQSYSPWFLMEGITMYDGKTGHVDNIQYALETTA